MLRDEEINAAASQLTAYRKNAELESILTKYADLIEDYRRLKSDYEEERDAREKYKQLARSREQSPFALVLVDGDGYVFHENFLEKGGDGGNNAAHAINSAVASSLKAKGLENCQVMVRVYANLMGLSKALARNGLAGHEARSLAPFVSNFNRSFGLTEFIDAGSLKENADFKIRAALSFYAESPQCKHIYFAACHDVGYISELMPYLGNSERFTLVRSSSVKFHGEFTKLGMGVEDMPGVFRTAPLTESSSPPYRTSSTFATVTAATNGNSKTGPSASSTYQTTDTPSLLKGSKDDSQRTVCQFYKIGKCRFGKSCKLLHTDDNGNIDGGNGNAPTNGRSLSVWSSHSSSGKVPMSPLPSDDCIVTWKGRPLDDLDIPRDQVAINRNDHRLDCHLSVSSDAVAKLKARARNRGLCNKFHLTGSCEAGSQCEFDHSWLPMELLRPLQALARSMPCPRRGACRDIECTKGHICQTAECRYRGGKIPCKIPYNAHSEDLEVDRFVDGRHDTSGTTNNGTSSNGNTTINGNSNGSNNNNARSDSLLGSHEYESESSDGVSVSL